MSEFDKLKALKKFKEMQKWHPVSNIPEEKCVEKKDIPEEKCDDIYKDLPKVKKWHDDYVKLWLGGRND